MQLGSRLELLTIILLCSALAYCRKRVDKTKCPKVKSLRNFDLHELLGSWYVVQYYATSEEVIAYSCMRAIFSMPVDGLEVQMNFTYSFADDPNNDKLVGNITWLIPDPAKPAHWVHAEDSYEGVYNTYVLDADYKQWSLLLHCAEKSKSPRYLSSLLMSRTTSLPPNVVAFLREKLPRYDVALEYMFPMGQQNCDDASQNLHYALPTKKNSSRRHPMKHRHSKKETNKDKKGSYENI